MRVVDLFSGCGGLSLGFEETGFEIVGAYDNWLPAVESYRANFNHDITLGDLSEVDCLPPCDVMVGGPPCQGFSSAGRRKDGDDRNSLVRTFSQLIVESAPKVFLFENVEGFITLDGGSYLLDLLDPLVEAGYQIHLRKVNVSNYGVPQHRKRVIAIGGLQWDPGFPDATHSTFGAPGAHLANRLGMARTPTFDDALSGLSPAIPRADRKSEQSDHSFSPFSADDQARAAAMLPGQRMRDLPEEMWHSSYRKRAFRRVMDGTPTERRGGAPSGLRRLSGDEPSKAITGGALRDFVHPHEDRPLTVRECARLQTFPDTFQFIGSVGECIQQIGNAVPPAFARILAQHILSNLANYKPTNLSGALASFVPTNSIGMSPALKRVCAEVQECFEGAATPEQGQLCL